MPCPYCNDSHSAFDPCPESIAAITAREAIKKARTGFDESGEISKEAWDGIRPGDPER